LNGSRIGCQCTPCDYYSLTLTQYGRECVSVNACPMFACSTLVAHGAYEWASSHELHTTAKDELITGHYYCIISTMSCRAKRLQVTFLAFSLFTDYDTKSNYTPPVKILAATCTSNWWFLTLNIFLKGSKRRRPFMLGGKRQC